MNSSLEHKNAEYRRYRMLYVLQDITLFAAFNFAQRSISLDKYDKMDPDSIEKSVTTYLGIRAI